MIKNINLKQLAEILNLSQTTISRALNGFPEVSSRTRKLVIDAAAEHNYQPNTRAKRLATGKSLTIGHLVSVSKEHEMVNPIFSDFIAGASARYAESGYDLLLSLVPDEDEFTAYKELAARSAVDGVVVHAPRVSERRIALLNELNLPFVVHGRSSEAVEDYNWVDVNNERSFFRASKEHEMVNPIFSDFIAGASARYAESGYDLLLSLVPDEDEFTAYKELAARSAVDGVVVHAPRVSERRIALLNELNLPFVVHGRSSEAVEDYNWVDVNNERSFFRATQFLIDLGHETIALINGVADMDFAMRRSLGFRRALSKNNIYISDDYTFNGEMTEPYGYRSTLVLLELPRPPTAIITSSIIVANGIRRALEDNGLKLGRDISVITHDDDLSYFRDTATVPVYTATRSSVREAGRISADLLIKTIEDPTRAKEGILLDSELIVGSSTKPPKP